jgi:hypothetical protein
VRLGEDDAAVGERGPEGLRDVAAAEAGEGRRADGGGEVDGRT